MDEQLKSNLTSSKHWFRLLFMIMFALLLQVALAVMWVLVGVQFLFALISGSDNRNLRKFGDSLSQFIFETIQFLTYNSEDKPFPFSDWPEANVVEEEQPGSELASETVATQSSAEPEPQESGSDTVTEEQPTAKEPKDEEKK